MSRPTKTANNFLHYSISGITVSAVLDVRKKDIVKDLCPIRIRITHLRTSIFYSTGYKLLAERWDRFSNSKSKNDIETRESLTKVFDNVKRHVKELAENEQFSFENINKRLSNASGDSVNTAFTAKVNKLYNSGKISTSDWYKNTLSNLVSYGGDNIQFRNITIEWLRRFENHLLDKGRSYTTVSMLMRALRAIVNEAVGAGVVKKTNYPFGKDKYEIPDPKGRQMALTLEQIGKIVNYQCKNATMERCRDLWFFSYLCNGANITDICKLKFSNIHNGEIYFYRQKTFGKGKMIEIRATLSDRIFSIINKLGNPDKSPNNFIFNVLVGDENPYDERRKIKNLTRHINEYMDIIGNDLGLGKISTYHARHSYATVLKRSGVNIAYISESLGHANLKTTENYLAKFESEERKKNAQALTNF
jgi:integrase/recombinase XerD